MIFAQSPLCPNPEIRPQGLIGGPRPILISGLEKLSGEEEQKPALSQEWSERAPAANPHPCIPLIPSPQNFSYFSG